MNMKKIIFTITLLTAVVLQAAAQYSSEPKKKKWYTTRGGDAGLVSFSNVSKDGKMLNNVPRFTAFLNTGTNFNTDFSKHVGFFTGINGKNIGVIYDDTANTRWKRRVLLLGVPAGFKFGNLEKGNFFYIGAQADLAINYKEKKFVNGDKVFKNNDWFGKQTPLFMPSFFAGFRTSKKVGLKAQYFPNNFFNQDFTKDNSRPFAGMEANVFFITLSYDFTMREFVSGSTKR
jgi:hypothetical protein